MSEVTISYTIREVFLVRDSKKRSIEGVPFKKSVKLKDGDRIVTGPASYVSDLWDMPSPIKDEKGTGITMFPNSELVLGIKGNHLIIRIELVTGLFKITTDKEVIAQTAELRFPHGVNVFWVDIAKDVAVVVASETAPMEVVHKKNRKAVVIGFKQQVTVTQEDILEPTSVDQRFKEASKVVEMLEQSKAKFLYGDMLERNVPQELQKFVRQAEEKTGRKLDSDPDAYVKYEKWLKEQKEFGEWKFDEAVESKLPEFKPQKLEEKITPKPILKMIVLNKSVNYQGIDFKIVSAEKGTKGWSTPEGKEFLILTVEVKNNSTKQVTIFYEEEVRVLNESGEIYPLENYKLENNFNPQFEAKGFLSFLVPKEDSKFKIQFGKKSLPKVEIEFEISEDSI